MYNKILDEAMLELRDEEFKGLFKDDVRTEFVKDCQIETDQEILIPKEYVAVTAERVSLYKELDSIETEDALLAYEKRMEDRFGPVPSEVNALFYALRLRWIGKKIGFEKILLKNDRLFGYFITNQESNYFQSDVFNHILDYFKQNQKAVNMRENKGKLSLIFRQVPDVKTAIEKIKPLLLGEG